MLLIVKNSENSNGEEGTPHTERSDSVGEAGAILQIEGKHETN